MVFSSLTKEEIKKAWDSPMKLNMKLYEAGRARHEMDFMWGVTFSRALMTALRNAGGSYRHILSAGRVQTPMLKVLVDLEEKIRNFKPEKYWELVAKITINGKTIIATYTGNPIKNLEEAKKLYDQCKGKKALVTDVRHVKTVKPPPVPFDTTELQKECSRWLRISPQDTINIGEGLYLEGAISYIRTDSQVYPEGLNHREILAKIAQIYPERYKKLVETLLKKKELKPVKGKKGGKEAAHPAIHPTGVKPGKITRKQEKMYDLIVRRYMATMGDPMIRETTKLKFNIGGLPFKASATKTIEKGWGIYYEPYLDLEELDIGPVHKGEIYPAEVGLLEKLTKPPPRMTAMKLVLWAEKNGIGTKATRGEMVKKLIKRKYVKQDGRSLIPTPLGIGVIKVLEDNSPILLSIDMTRQFENMLNMVLTGEKTRDEILNKAVEEIKILVEKFNSKIEGIGKELYDQLSGTITDIIGICEKCGKPLKIIRKRNGKRFVWCTTPNCTFYPLPQKGELTVTDKTCPRCGLKVIRVKRKGKRAWNLCVKCGICFQCPDYKTCYKKS